MTKALPPAARGAVHAVSVNAGRLTHQARMLPGFLIVGAQRCGTTSMYRTLSQHPAILKAVLHKGVHYFDTRYDHGLAWYQGHFPLRARAAAARRATGDTPLTFESSPYYLFHPLAGQRIAADLPGVKLLVLVRDPVERAYSAHELARGFETEPFERALDLEDQRLAGQAEKIIADPGYHSHGHQHHAYRACSSRIPNGSTIMSWRSSACATTGTPSSSGTTPAPARPCRTRCGPSSATTSPRTTSG